MISGVITARHILSHPMALIAAIGFIAYADMVLKIFSRREYRFAELMYRAQK